ncbi:three-helix bundle dimerization domain-containing protein [Microbacterium telephonicum]|uniref:Uncharacterized protein DUF3562 n=1 Tax=Microbacterium telephonicum TaxID=1714841 RepID=A0A498CIT1_9MICO|nr:DUF3562 domain-containing protein [Microbacterium telephonicum]RLK52138.1 uncharacterized protein DUF3562 [Microbacterium telephonicum]
MENTQHADTRQEELAIDAVIDRIATKFPTLDHDHVEQVVHDEVHTLDDAHVRDYIPVVVEHSVTEKLREEADPVPLAERIPQEGDVAAPYRDRGGDERRSESAGPLLGGSL